jgi:hypothetical protein
LVKFRNNAFKAMTVRLPGHRHAAVPRFAIPNASAIRICIIAPCSSNLTYRYMHMRIVAVYLCLILGLVFSSGCASTLHVQSKRHLQRFDGGARPVYVTNPELQPEYDVLRASGIYPLSTQRDGARLLTIHPMRQYGGCGNPLMLTIFTFGIVPGWLPADRTFEYELQTDGATQTYEHHLPVYERFSLWERFLRRDEQKALAEGLAWAPTQRPRTATLTRERPTAQVGDHK